MDLMQEMLAVLAVVGLLGGALWLLRRKGIAQFSLGRMRSRAGRRLEFMERLPLTAQHSVCLVRLADRAILIGLSPSGCNLISNLPWKDVEPIRSPRPEVLP